MRAEGEEETMNTHGIDLSESHRVAEEREGRSESRGGQNRERKGSRTPPRFERTHLYRSVSLSVHRCVRLRRSSLARSSVSRSNIYLRIERGGGGGSEARRVRTRRREDEFEMRRDEQVSGEWERRLHAELGCPERSRSIPREDRREYWPNRIV